MDAKRFISKWEQKQNSSYSKFRKAVGLHIEWQKISLDSKVLQFTGKKAWKKIEYFYAPIWGNFVRTPLYKWLSPQRPDYMNFIEEQKENIKFYELSGLVDPEFCAFASSSGNTGVLGDGNHRFINLNYLIFQGKNLESEIDKCRLDIVCLNNLSDVVPIDYLPEMGN